MTSSPMTGTTTRLLRLLALAGAVGLLGGPAAGRQAQQPHDGLATLGILICSLGGAGAGPAASSRDVLCQFRFDREGTRETYTGTIRSVGQTQALYAKGTVMLAVKGPASTDIVPGLLQQTYSVEAALASAAAPLVGETNGAIVLQPWMEETGRVAAGKARPDVTIIAVELTLEASPA